MKRVFVLGSLFLVSTLSLISCRETSEENEKEVIVREVEVEKETPAETEERKGILERTGERVDKEVNEEIDEEIDKIGDDN
ncbi:MAG: hypothetical protein RI572_12205 [Salegentibacter sp.]|uniref:Uncharacterized protein n=1 Tax=Salegentibacter flavus TaxID=287099 RepID=A0A1I4YYZ9_9FLAO|nr:MULTISPECIES: hypothetical protein [Salegentibacter]MDR9458162.1 hypothetical protein [Salegentibacter sp.]SFN43224.1 hypothetical protein SAMN05660413_01045 [Salegentibacter flavus]